MLFHFIFAYILHICFAWKPALNHTPIFFVKTYYLHPSLHRYSKYTQYLVCTVVYLCLIKWRPNFDTMYNVLDQVFDSFFPHWQSVSILPWPLGFSNYTEKSATSPLQSYRYISSTAWAWGFVLKVILLLTFISNSLPHHLIPLKDLSIIESFQTKSLSSQTTSSFFGFLMDHSKLFYAHWTKVSML